MTVRLTPVLRAARLQLLLDAIDVGSNLLILDGVQPSPGGAETARLGVIPFLDPVGSITDQTLTLNLQLQQAALENGDPTWARIIDNNGDWVLDMTVGQGVTVDPVPVVQGGYLNVLSAVISE